jgi:putative AbiEi antitoxin of type IV toxin-antitoxin system
MAGSTHGVVTRGQLLRAGITRRQIAARMRSGTLLREYPGVYRVGHRARSTEATYLAAVLAGGDGALLCGRAAAHLLGLIRGEAPAAEVITTTERRLEGIKTYRTRHLNAQDRAVCRGIPVTSVARTLVDLAAVLSEEALARACHEAGVRYGLTPNAVAGVLARRPRAKGARTLRRIIEGEVQVTLSKLESRFVKILREQRFPLPLTNRPAGGRRVDCRWPEFQLTVELDSYRFHNTRYAWEQDRRREREARARGDDFRRYTYGDVFEHPKLMLAELHTFFGAKRPG